MTSSELALVEAARAARQHAYAPYSRYQVGAAVRSTGGRIFTGCNVENASYGLSMCAERNAIFAAVAAGDQRLEAVAVATSANPPGTPCGACRQVLQEFAVSPEMTVTLASDSDETKTFSLGELFPHPFVLE